MTLTPLTFGKRQVDASYIVKSALDIVYVRSMSINSTCIVAGARRVGSPPLKIPRYTPDLSPIFWTHTLMDLWISTIWALV